MPAKHVVAVSHPVALHTVLKHGRDEPVTILQESPHEPRVFVHYVNLDKRNDEWVPKTLLKPTSTEHPTVSSKKRKRSSQDASGSPSRSQSPSSEEAMHETEQIVMTEEEYDIQFHKQINDRRNFDQVYVGEWLIKTWYFSPYPLTENEDAEPALSQGSNPLPNRIPGLTRTTLRAHGRTSELLAGGMGRRGEKEILYVCEMCFKYMTDGSAWEGHKKQCTMSHPPGRKVYQRGAHTIWEVDGAKEKLYCQNLSLFGKLFIDIKTLFFDTENFLYYVLTDATRNSDHMLGYFSKVNIFPESIVPLPSLLQEKRSYDDYNLACIITLPPFQRKGFGRLMIEFSYELSRRAGKVGTPERPLSDLGLRSYLAYWVSTLIRFFRKLLEVMPMSAGADTVLVTRGNPPDFRSPSRESSEDSIPRRRKRYKGWDGELSQEEEVMEDIDEKLASLRTFVTTRNPDGSATVHLRIQCSLVDIADATNLRVDDAAFALNEMGLLKTWGQDSSDQKPVVVLTRDMVEKVAEERGVKPGYVLHLSHVKL
ncbi:acyl-CoA N-acyltransferase [Rhodocollybia butyracea]|uniref:Acyl-CoA N-acyltransferase n=1 Tax=Rhodocollybia butyracea TaxID=206335 RepID=A0A9P5UBE5_9AGAR|nr:acyl-CoA N-acyltransferase [Rhodocollybia butyracea]